MRMPATTRKAPTTWRLPIGSHDSAVAQPGGRRTTLCYPPVRRGQLRSIGPAFRRSSVVERAAVNRMVVSSNLTAGAIPPGPGHPPYDRAVTVDSRIDAYLAAFPAEQRALLEGVRRQVSALVPEAVETISYGMPTFKLGDRFLLSYAGWKRHCSLYGLDAGRAAASHGFKGTKGTLQFSLAQPLPAAILADLVARRLADMGAVRGRQG